jgi:hypothetical protein
VLVLAVEREQPAAQLAQVPDRRGPTAGVRAGAAVGPHAPGEHDLLGARWNQREIAEAVRQREDALHVRLGGAAADDPAPRASAEQ